MQAIISTGNKQYLVEPGQILEVELSGDAPSTDSGQAKKLEFAPLMMIDGAKSVIGRPTLKDKLVKAELITEVKGPKLKVLRFKAKKRVKSLTGHRQHYAQIKITSIA